MQMSYRVTADRSDNMKNLKPNIRKTRQYLTNPNTFITEHNIRKLLFMTDQSPKQILVFNTTTITHRYPQAR
jgi:hypothetical protein